MIKDKKNEVEPYDRDLNPLYWRVTISVIVNAPDESIAREETVLLTSDRVERFISVEKAGEGLDY